jgi:hypothetical protein
VTSQLIVFAHVVAMIGLFVALTLEWTTVLSMRRARTYEDARHADLHRWLTPIGIPATLGVLGSGVWLASTLGLWSLYWVKAAVPILVLVAIAGGIVAPRRKRVRVAIADGAGAIPPAVIEAIHHRLFVGSLWTRTALLIGLVFAMTVKP